MLPEIQDHQRQLAAASPQTKQQAVRSIGRGLQFVVLLLIAAELIAPPEYKPSARIGAFHGNMEATELRAKLEETRAMLAAQNEENAKMQNSVERFKARTERVTQAYRTALERINMAAQSIATLQQQILSLRQKTVAQLEAGNIAMANIGDMAGIFGAIMGNEKLAKDAFTASGAVRAQVLGRLDEEGRKGAEQMATLANNLTTGLPNPERLINDEIENPIMPAPGIAQPQKPLFYRNAPRGRLALVTGHFPGLAVRSEPRKTKANNRICSLAPGAVVAVTGDDRIFDADNNVTFVPIRFYWQGHGETDGWTSERGLGDYSGTEAMDTPQACGT